MTAIKQTRHAFENIARTLAFEVKAIAATDRKPTRIKITDIAHNKSKIINIDYEFNSFTEQVFAVLSAEGYSILSKVPALKNGNDLIICTWEKNHD